MPHKVLISGGGTGGHIFPAIAIANSIKEIRPETEFLFVGAIGKMEMEKVPAAGYKIIGLNISGIQRSLSLSNFMFPVRLALSLIRAREVIKCFNPDVVVGVGGFASGPVLRVATWMSIPTLIQEQNSFAGITNRWVAGSVNKVCVAYDGMEKFFPKDRIIKTGNPVRKEMVQIEGKRLPSLSRFELKADRPVMLVIGGSLGARSINLTLADQIEQLLDIGIQVIWQTGKLFDALALMRAKYKSKGLFITDFIHDMDAAYAAADMVVSRAGAIAVSELSIIAKPVILVPFPHAAEDHQTQNAMALVKTGAALHVADKDVREQLIPMIIALSKDSALQTSLSERIVHHALPQAAQVIATEVLKLIKR